MNEERLVRRDIVLAVDDTPESLSLLTDTLESAGITVLVATSGEGALNLLDEVTPDLILMDAMMPGIDGFETCRRIRQEKRLTQLPVIFMTGLTETEHVLRGLEVGGVDYVTKPLILSELLARIRVHLANARVAQASHTALDATGRFLLSVDASGQPQWCTPRAEQLLAQLFKSNPTELRFPKTIADYLTRLRVEGVIGGPMGLTVGTRKLEFSYISSAGPGEYLFRLAEIVMDTDVEQAKQALMLQGALVLTAREADVLLWISRGKSNRDVSEILGISPRTVNKHLEQVFEKLGVENRASAAARAVRILSQ
ncbi:response regulator transcription factor [Stenotrophobium rhamnosiphilum]|uniref:DNA-binding response regulator n=1 Tax=Stenotrophobium rhamnosiphilum TaxID=2029166 RepID=A0A2T5MFJ4_9GAMM|nr:response regulator transcription factor [Stenotrophobium rhamnosiphilum]PTU31336.1 DNA-binding response regulator [Stenotrophobium rhamnosiphilum]